jgi:Zn-dependent peptidase ImmA (M78 family)
MSVDAIRERTAERRADQLISDLQIVDEADIDIEAIAMARGALVVDGGLSGAEARLARSSRLSFIRVNSEIREPGRRRFAIAHELGHLLLQQSSQIALCTDRDLVPFYTNSPDELEASAFAGALLMPAAMFEPLCNISEPSLRYVAEIAKRFHVTLTAATFRYIRYCPHRCCLVASTNGKIRYHRKTEDFGYFIAPGKDLDARSYAVDYFKGEPLSEGMQEVEASAWIEGKHIDSRGRILEQSIPMPSYDAVLTLLWIDKDIDHYVTGEDEYDAEQEASDRRWPWNRYPKRRT